MRVFVTGATGFVGSAVVDDLQAAGHRVLGLARSDAGAASLSAKGVEVLRGDLEDMESIRRGAQAADAVIHTAFIHEFTRFAECCAVDRRAIEVLGGALEGSARPILVTGGLAHLASGRPATEDDRAPAASVSFPRASEAAAAGLAARGVRVGVVRLPIVHGTGDHGFLPILIALAQEKGVSAYIGEGRNRWAAAHRKDAARVYRLALEQGVKAPVYHAVGEEGLELKTIAEVIGRRLHVPVVAKTGDEVAGHFGWFAPFAGMEALASSAQTRERLAWTPDQPGLIADLEHAGYFPA